jgi:nucleoid-associated protein YgaU
MRTIGNIERFLVIGIVVVIGAILAVAIKGADDVDSAYKKQAQAKADEKRRLGGTALNRTNPVHPGSGAAAPAPGPSNVNLERTEKSETGTDAKKLSQTLQDILNSGPRQGDGTTPPAGAGEKGDPAKGAGASQPVVGEPSGSTSKPDGEGSSPIVIDDSKSPPEGPVAGPAPTPPVVHPNGDAKRDSSGSTALDWTYEVQPGDRLERIATTLYGEKSMWKEIMAVNPAYPDATRIRAGAVLVLPKAPTNTTATGLAHGTAKVASGDGHHDVKAGDTVRASQPADGTKSTTYKRVTGSDQYEVQKGDTLMAIAATHYGTRSAWRTILAANSERIADKDHLKPGTILKLPAE